MNKAFWQGFAEGTVDAQSVLLPIVMVVTEEPFTRGFLAVGMFLIGACYRQRIRQLEGRLCSTN